MKYQPLAEVRKTLYVKWYRSKIDRTTLRNLSKRSDAQGWFQAGGHLALWLLTGSVVYLFWAQAMWLGFFVALFLH
ncbi:MAG: fatty acid desaturase, partial [Candidatus Poribacteria bacterium]|nr:fatty acid desaturase [Candidatus Poribacteria bacterium]